MKGPYKRRLHTKERSERVRENFARFGDTETHQRKVRSEMNSVYNSEDKWLKLERIVRKVFRDELQSIRLVVREELSQQLQLFKKTKIEFSNGKFTGITEEQMHAWQAAYPGVDIQAQLNQAAAWIISNPDLAPKSQPSRFINNWLTKQQNQHSLRSIPTSRPSAIPPSLCEYCLLSSIGAINGRRHCADHAQDAMDGVRPQKMPGQIAKAVAGS